MNGCIIYNNKLAKEVNNDLIYFRCAKAFGWTPEQVDKIGKEQVDSLLEFDTCVNKKKNQK